MHQRIINKTEKTQPQNHFIHRILSKEYEVQIDLYFNKENEEITRKL